jgi:hypothetical protein
MKGNVTMNARRYSAAFAQRKADAAAPAKTAEPFVLLPNRLQGALNIHWNCGHPSVFVQAQFKVLPSVRAVIPP